MPLLALLPLPLAPLPALLLPATAKPCYRASSYLPTVPDEKERHYLHMDFLAVANAKVAKVAKDALPSYSMLALPHRIS